MGRRSRKKDKKSQNKVYERFLTIEKMVFFHFFSPFLPGFCLSEEAGAYARHMHFREPQARWKWIMPGICFSCHYSCSAEPPDEEAPKFLPILGIPLCFVETMEVNIMK